jgi:DNA-binding NarL/FixJ family response regulator
MDWKTVVVFDGDDARRRASYRELAPHIVTLPIGEIADLGASWPESAWFFVHDEPALMAALQQAFAARGVAYPIVAYSESLVPSRMVAAIHGGAVSYVQWPCDAATIIGSLSSVAHAAQRHCEQAVMRIASEQRLATLSPRELEVARRVVEGMTSKQIGRELGISPRTVEIHRSNMMHKIGARNTAEAAVLLAEGRGAATQGRASYAA